MAIIWALLCVLFVFLSGLVNAGFDVPCTREFIYLLLFIDL